MPEQKHGQRIILMDGTTLEDGRCGFADGFLWCWVKDVTFQQAAEIFLDPAKTGKIIYEYGEMTDEYEGFTGCKSISVQYDEVAVCLVEG